MVVRCGGNHFWNITNHRAGRLEGVQCHHVEMTIDKPLQKSNKELRSTEKKFSFWMLVKSSRSRLPTLNTLLSLRLKSQIHRV